MVCIYCSEKTQVTNSRASPKTRRTWRRRECTSCKSVVTTYEQIDYASALRVINKQTDLQPFSRDKLFMSLNRSLQHRETALTDASDLADTVTHRLLASVRAVSRCCKLLFKLMNNLSRENGCKSVCLFITHSALA